FLNRSDTTPLGALLARNPAAEPVLIPPVTGESGMAGTFNMSTLQQQPNIYFGVNTSDEKLIRILQMLNAIYSDEKMYALVEYGIEGEHYNVVDGRYVPVPET